MPYVTTTTTIRPTQLTLLFIDTMPYQYTTPMYNVPGFVSSRLIVSADRLTITEERTWNSAADADNFKVADPRMLTPSFSTAHAIYNNNNGIQETSLAFQTTP
jgi:hypothetical protein